MNLWISISRSAQKGCAPRNFLVWKFGSGFFHNDTITQLQDSLAEWQKYWRSKTNELKCIRYDTIRLEVDLAPEEADASANRMNSLINLLGSCGFPNHRGFGQRKSTNSLVFWEHNDTSTNNKTLHATVSINIFDLDKTFTKTTELFVITLPGSADSTPPLFLIGWNLIQKFAMTLHGIDFLTIGDDILYSRTHHESQHTDALFFINHQPSGPLFDDSLIQGSGIPSSLIWKFG